MSVRLAGDEYTFGVAVSDVWDVQCFCSGAWRDWGQSEWWNIKKPQFLVLILTNKVLAGV